MSTTSFKSSTYLETPVLKSVEEFVLVSVVMPCLNEARTLAACIDKAQSGCMAAIDQYGASGQLSATRHQLTLTYEIIVADNGSNDSSREIAAERDAMVVNVERKGYGAAILGGIAAARGKFVVMGDSDCSYDFTETPRFIELLANGNDLVLGNRFSGLILPGAMPWHHRYIGNPLLSGLGRLLFRPGCRDFHCGLRAFARDKINSLHLKCEGMELASEMVIRAAQEKLKISEIPITLYPDGRNRPPHLRSFRDGFRHLKLICLSRLGVG